MVKKKEDTEVDFIVDSRPLTKMEEVAISEFIKADKAKNAKTVKMKFVKSKTN